MEYIIFDESSSFTKKQYDYVQNNINGSIIGKALRDYAIQATFKKKYVQNLVIPKRPMIPISTSGLKKTPTGYSCFSLFSDPREPLK